MAQSNSGKVIAWFVGGAALGAAVALLLAPDSGEETRRKLGEQAQKSRKAFGSGGDIIEKGRELYERGRELAEEAADLFEKGRRIAEKRVHDHL